MSEQWALVNTEAETACPLCLAKWGQVPSPWGDSVDELDDYAEHLREHVPTETAPVRDHVYEGERCAFCGVNMYDSMLHEDQPRCPREPITYTVETGWQMCTCNGLGMHAPGASGCTLPPGSAS